MLAPELLKDGDSYEDAELCCQICGVSFNISRIRSTHEPVSSAWCGGDEKTWGFTPIAGSYVEDELNGEETGCSSCLVADRTIFGDDESDLDYMYQSDDENEPSEYDEIMAVNQDDEIAGPQLEPTRSENDGCDSQKTTRGGPRAKHSKEHLRFIESIGDPSLMIQPSFRPRSAATATRHTDYEHIASKTCCSKRGYNGNEISVGEMKACTTAQFLVPEESGVLDAEPNGIRYDDTDTFLLHGLTDRMTRIDTRRPSSVYPYRFGHWRLFAANVILRPHTANSVAMPFHPYCLEVYKRASLRRFGRLDMDGLTGWFRLEANPVEFLREFPRHEAVRRGARGSEWQHVLGDEWVVANPCIIPAWDRFLGSIRLEVSEKCRFMSGNKRKMESLLDTDLFAKLPLETRLTIVDFLHAGDIINLQAATRSFWDLPQSFFRELIFRDAPWFWDAWCALPYSFWATTTEMELRARSMQLKETTWDIETWQIPVLEEEGVNGECSAAMEALRNRLLDLNRKEQDSYTSQEAPLLDRQNTDWSRLYRRLTRANTIKGLRNRARIWKDCDSILDRIEVHRKSGRMSERGVCAQDACEEFLREYPHLRLGPIRPR